MGLNACYVNAEPSNEDMQQGVLERKYHVRICIWARNILDLIDDVITLRNHARHPTTRHIAMCQAYFPHIK